MKRNQSNLLRDFAILVKRYPSKEWSRLADLLDNSNARSKLLLLLRGVAGVKDFPSKAPLRQKPSVKSPSKKREMIERFDLELSRLSISQLRDIARNRGLPISTKDSKERLIRRILASARNAPLGIRSAEQRSKESSSDYAQWAEIIMGGGKQRR